MPQRSRIISLLVLLVFLLGALGYLEYRHYRLSQHASTLEKELTETKTELASTTKNLSEYIEALKHERDTLQQKLTEEQARMNFLAAQMEGITNTVGVLEKLSELDPELLKKYSRVYFLNENYMPKELTAIADIHLYEPQKPLYILKNTALFLNALMDSANNADIDIRIVSAYRSFGTQAELKYAYTTTYGSGANQFSADQGYSEHQLGTAVDFTTDATQSNLNEFKNTPAYVWLNVNAYQFGFTLSYPENNAYYQFEPWHWRFVGRELAAKLRNEGKHFYDLEQRIIDTYLISIFD
ncbi:MAG: D-alanyl-D-alanine carboxypeptidase family protein [Candidatus Niyogibacteria bacterium]|nr:D-alanyl-D-alanine carboxypeptidase family protein [Candidatus Niyogibacteria bacterium]